MQRSEGGEASLAVACPPGTRTDTPTRRVPLRSLDTNAGAERVIEIHVRCAAATLHVPVIVQIDGPDDLHFPLTLDGAAIGATDARGTAHVLAAVQPHAILRVGLDTSSRPELRPRSPVHTFRVSHAPRVLLVAQRLKVPRPSHRLRATRPQPATRDPLPYRIH